VNPEGASASERLALTRLAILDYLQRREHGEASWPPPETTDEPPDADASRWRGLRDAGRRYWQDHPARWALELTTPLLSHWAQRHPVALLGVAALAGALLVFARPWRLLSVTGVAVAALKSPQLASLAMSLLASTRAGRHRPRP
jgi:hypothetical protein